MTQTNIPYERRNQIKSIVAVAYEHFANPKLPLEVKAFVRSFSNIRLTSYSKHMKRIGVSYEYLISIAKDSYTDYYANMEMYYIYYNDIDRNIVTSNRYRWNIAHELGHVLLGHLRDNEKTRLTRPALPDDEYLYLEDEADYFAQLILVPHSPLLGFNIQTSNHIKILCKISGPASRKRYFEFMEWKRHVDGNDQFDKRIFSYYHNFVFKRECKNCDAGLIQRHGKYCPICGSKNTLQWGDGNKMKYPLLSTYEDGKLTECPVCHNEETNIEGNYCHICSQKLTNMCTNQNCDNYDVLPTNARFCPMCGGESSFLKSGILKAWNYKEPSSMEIPDLFDVIDAELPFN